MKRVIVIFILLAFFSVLYSREGDVTEIKISVPDVTPSQRADLVDIIGFVSNMKQFLNSKKDKGAEALFLERAGENLTGIIKRSDPSLKLLQLRKKILNREFSSLPGLISFGEKEALSLFFSMNNGKVKYYVFKITVKDSDNDKKISALTSKIASECLSSLKVQDGIKPLKSNIMYAEVISAWNEDLFFHYMSENQEKETVMNLIIFSNLTKPFFDMSIKKKGELVFDKRVADTVTYKSFMLLCKLQFTGRLFGPVIIEKAGDKVLRSDVALGDDFSKVMEIKAFSSALAALDILKREGVIDEYMRRSVYATYISVLVNNSGYPKSSSAGESALVQLNYFLKKGAVFYNLNKKKLAFHFPKAYSVAESLVKSSVRFLFKGSTGSFFAKYSKKMAVTDKIPGYKSLQPPFYKIRYELDLKK